jgi:DNA-binding response OmpR family regulator
VLIAENDEVLAKAVAVGLRREGMAVDVAFDGDDARSRLALALTAASSVKDRVEGLVLGADDYLPKPFEFAELIARIRAVARRPAMPPADLTYGDLSLDPVGRVAFRAGLRLKLSRNELAVLECLLAAEGNPVSAEELIKRVWDDDIDPYTATVKTTISRLRTKLGGPPLIETIRESGYRIGGP